MVATHLDGERFIAVENGRRVATTLTLVVALVSDAIVAVDSISVIFAITPNPFIVPTSNIFAVLGRGAMYGRLGT